MTSKKYKPIKIYFDAQALTEDKISGVGMVLLETLRALDTEEIAGKQYEINLVVVAGRREKLSRHNFIFLKIRTIPLPVKVFAAINRFNLPFPVDLVLGKGTYIFPNYRNWSLIMSRSITYIHDVAFLKYPGTLNPANLRYLMRNYRKWIDRSDKIIAVSHASAAEMVEMDLVPQSKIRVITNGVTEEYSKRTRIEVNEALKKYKFPFVKYLLFIGNLEPRKNLSNLLLAYGRLPLGLKEEYGLVFIGSDGWLNDELVQEIKILQKEGRVFRPDSYVETEDMPALISGAAALVQPSIHEGFGLPVVEALACQTPVIISDIPVLKELTSSVESLVFDHTSPLSMSETICSFLKNPTVIDNKQASKIAAKYSWHGAAEKLLEEVNHQARS